MVQVREPKFDIGYVTDDLRCRHYPGNIAGIFLDEAWNECGADDIYAKVYRLISDNTKRRHEGAYIVLNPGWFMPKCFEERSVMPCTT